MIYNFLVGSIQFKEASYAQNILFFYVINSAADNDIGLRETTNGRGIC